MNKIWTPQEDKVLSKTRLSYDRLCEMLPHRSRNSIWQRSHKLGFTRDTSVIQTVNSENQRKKEWTSLLDDKEFCEIIDGELLGDGCIYRKKVKNRQCYEYSFIAGSIHREYAEYVHDKLSSKLKSKACIKTVFPKENREYNSKIFYSVRFSNVIFESFYQRWYPTGSIKTSIPTDLRLSPQSCLHWYLGDGSLDSRSAAKMFDLSLHTENFDTKSIGQLVDKIDEEAGVMFTITRTKKKYKKLRIHGNKARKFLSYIGTCPVRCFDYKWRDWK